MPKHKWIPSTLGHGGSICTKCAITSNEATVLGEMDYCAVEDPVGTSLPDLLIASGNAPQPQDAYLKMRNQLKGWHWAHTLMAWSDGKDRNDRILYRGSGEIIKFDKGDEPWTPEHDQILSDVCKLLNRLEGEG